MQATLWIYRLPFTIMRVFPLLVFFLMVMVLSFRQVKGAILMKMEKNQ